MGRIVLSVLLHTGPPLLLLLVVLPLLLVVLPLLLVVLPLLLVVLLPLLVVLLPLLVVLLPLLVVLLPLLVVLLPVVPVAPVPELPGPAPVPVVPVVPVGEPVDALPPTPVPPCPPGLPEPLPPQLQRKPAAASSARAKQKSTKRTRGCRSMGVPPFELDVSRSAAEEDTCVSDFVTDGCDRIELCHAGRNRARRCLGAGASETCVC
jgi:hypothetical protein